MLTAEASVRRSAWPLATRARVWTLAYIGMAMAARMPMMATTIISSMSVKPRWFPSGVPDVFRCIRMVFSPLGPFRPLIHVNRALVSGRLAASEVPPCCLGQGVTRVGLATFFGDRVAVNDPGRRYSGRGLAPALAGGLITVKADSHRCHRSAS